MDHELQALFVEADDEAVAGWSEMLLQALGELSVPIPPRPALVMVHARDSVERQPFCLGEALVTECQIACVGQHFWGRVLGDQPGRALAMAILNAALALAPEALEDLTSCFAAERSRLQAEREHEARVLATTRVQFETMTLT
jgi:alpha-D-ribose 1-methylphosphonate 5-triphosphate synthase subunit PhnG